jgi:hypothetical protein
LARPLALDPCAVARYDGRCMTPRVGTAGARKARRKRKSGSFWSRVVPTARTRGRWWRTLRRAPLAVQIAAGAMGFAVVALSVNWIYQVYRKPAELFFPVSGSLYKQPAQTWRAYGSLFRRHSTLVMTPALLAAIAQVEGSGNPVVRTYWRWSLTRAPFEIYRPASSAVGMYQITDGTFDAARRYCIHDHAVVTDGAWYSLRSCWFNGLYTRTVPSHAIELTSAYLDRGVAETLRRHPAAKPTLRQRQQLAALIHLCGSGAANAFARRGFAVAAGQRCGAHDVRGYLARVESMQRAFAELETS